MRGDCNAMEVRSAVLPDAGTISALNCEVQALHAAALPHLFKPAAPTVFSAHEIRQLLTDPSTLMFIAHESGQPAGYIYAQVIEGSETPYRHAWKRLHIHHISVSRECQRTGIGRALLGELLEAARQRGLSTITADFWSFNEGAREFFKAQGFIAYNENIWLELEPGPK